MAELRKDLDIVRNKEYFKALSNYENSRKSRDQQKEEA